MIKYSGMQAKESNGNKSQLPAGPYVAIVKDARIEGNAPDQQLAIMLDISEGDYAAFYTTKYLTAKERGSNYEIKYKGIIRLRIPNEDNKKALYPESDKRKFNDMIARFQNSNPGVSLYGENGLDETRLKGLTVGISVQEDEYNGSRFTKIARLENADDVRQGKVAVMPPKQRDGGNPMTGSMMSPAQTVDQQSGMMTVNTVALPWDDKPY